MRVGLVKDNKVVTLVTATSVSEAKTIFPDYDDYVDAETPINQDFINQKIETGFVKKSDGTWFDPHYFPWIPPIEE